MTTEPLSAERREFDAAFGLALAVFLGLTGVSCLAALVVYMSVVR